MNFVGGLVHQINGGEAFGPFRRANAFLFMGGGFSYQEQLHDGVGTFFFSNWILSNYDEIGLNLQTDYLFGGYNLFETRGLGPRARPRELEFRIDYKTDTRRKWVIQPELDGMIYGDGGQVWGPNLGLEWDCDPQAESILEGWLEPGAQCHRVGSK